MLTTATLPDYEEGGKKETDRGVEKTTQKFSLEKNENENETDEKKN